MFKFLHEPLVNPPLVNPSTRSRMDSVADIKRTGSIKTRLARLKSQRDKIDEMIKCLEQGKALIVDRGDTVRVRFMVEGPEPGDPSGFSGIAYFHKEEDAELFINAFNARK